MIKKIENDKLSYLLGAFLGDGCAYVNKKYGTYQFSITSEDRPFAFCFSINTHDFCKKIGFSIERKDKVVKEFLLKRK